MKPKLVEQAVLRLAIHRELADATPEWFSSMTGPQQDKYLEEHPNSKIAKQRKAAKEERKTKESKKKATKVQKKHRAPHSEKDATDILKKAGSPTKYRGPKGTKDSMSGNPKTERKVVSLMDKLAAMARDAKEKGKAAPNYDLCQVSIPGTNLFCAGNKGIARKDMPQLKGLPVPGSWADKHLKKNDKGEVDAEDAFKAMLKKKGIKLSPKDRDVSELKATQSELVGTKVAGMLQALKDDPKHKGINAPIFVSRDGYVLDGHHRWAAMVGLDLADGRKEPVKMQVIEVDMNIEDLVKQTNDFANEVGIAQKAATTKKESSTLRGYKGCCG